MNNTEIELQAGIDRLTAAIELMRTGGEPVNEAISARLAALAEGIGRLVPAAHWTVQEIAAAFTPPEDS